MDRIGTVDIQAAVLQGRGQYGRLRFVSLLLVTAALGLALLGGCTPEIVQLAPNWPPTNSNDGGTGVNPDGGNNKEPGGTPETSPPTESKPSDTSNCQAAPQGLALLAPLAPQRGGLLLGDLGSVAANATLQAAVPTGWQVIPPQVQADAQGRFGFVIQRLGTAVTGDEVITVRRGNQWCYLVTPSFRNDNNQRQLQANTPQRCSSKSIATFAFPARGLLREAVQGRSSAPSVVAIQSLTMVQNRGIPRLEIQVSCNRSGSAYLLVGNANLEGTAIAVEVAE